MGPLMVAGASAGQTPGENNGRNIKTWIEEKPGVRITNRRAGSDDSRELNKFLGRSAAHTPQYRIFEQNFQKISRSHLPGGHVTNGRPSRPGSVRAGVPVGAEQNLASGSGSSITSSARPAPNFPCTRSPGKKARRDSEKGLRQMRGRLGVALPIDAGRNSAGHDRSDGTNEPNAIQSRRASMMRRSPPRPTGVTHRQ